MEKESVFRHCFLYCNSMGKCPRVFSKVATETKSKEKQKTGKKKSKDTKTFCWCFENICKICCLFCFENPIKIGSGQSHSLCYGGTLGNGYFRTSQTRKEKRKTAKDFTGNYVDRVRLAENTLQDYQKYPTRGSGWRHNRSISHLDLATSYSNAASGLNPWPHTRQQLRHSRSLDYNHEVDRLKTGNATLDDIAEFYWRIDPEANEFYDDSSVIRDSLNRLHFNYCSSGHHNNNNNNNSNNYISNNNKNKISNSNNKNSGGHNNKKTSSEQNNYYRDFNSADDFYHHLKHSGGSFISQTPRSSQAVNATSAAAIAPAVDYTTSTATTLTSIPPSLITTTATAATETITTISSSLATTTTTTTATPTTAAAAAVTEAKQPLQIFEFDGDACSLRRSRSLAVIREETFNDLQITSSNSHRRRSQLIPRARLVNRGFFQERERSIYGSNGNNSPSQSNNYKNNNNSGKQQQYQHHFDDVAGEKLQQTYRDQDGNSNSTYKSHHQYHSYDRHHKHDDYPQEHYDIHYKDEFRCNEDYYDNLNRLRLSESGQNDNVHPWHNDKSDLESLNSDYFKNSLHQSQEYQQHSQRPSYIVQHSEEQPRNIGAYEHAVNLLVRERPRIYQSHRQQQQQHLQRYTTSANHTTNVDSCPENSQSSVFPETTTSNSDDQTDSPSLSEQEYDLTRIEEIFHNTHLDADEESYELISLTTTTRTRIETTEDEEETNRKSENNDSLTDHLTDIASGSLRRAKAVSENLEKLIAYDSVYLSSEDGSEVTLIDEQEQKSFDSDQVTCDPCILLNDDNCRNEVLTPTPDNIHELQETATLLHISIEDSVYEGEQLTQQTTKETIEVSLNLGKAERSDESCQVIESINTEFEICEETDKTKKPIIIEKELSTIATSKKLDLRPVRQPPEQPLYTQVVKIESKPKATVTAISKLTQPTETSITDISLISNLKTTSSNSPSTVGLTSSAASKPKILTVVEKRKLKRHTDLGLISSQETTAFNLQQHQQQPHNNQNSIKTEAFSTDLKQANGNNNKDSPFTYLRRQATDSLYFPYVPPKTNLGDNQYHSLPDVNIGQSLKVSESIDAELRSSYNLNRHHHRHHNRTQEQHHNNHHHKHQSCTHCEGSETENIDSLRDCQSNEFQSEKLDKSLTLEANNISEGNQNRHEHELVTTEDIYDSIKRFGRAHQQARKREYQERLIADNAEKTKQRWQQYPAPEPINSEELQHASDTQLKIQEETKKEIDIKPEIIVAETRSSQDSPITRIGADIKETNEKEEAPTKSNTDELYTKNKEKETYEQKPNKSNLEPRTSNERSITESLETAAEKPEHEINQNTGLQSQDSSLLLIDDYEEKPKQGPDIEITNFSKQIERRAKEIEEIRLQHKQLPLTKKTTTTFTSATFRINKVKTNACKINSDNKGQSHLDSREDPSKPSSKSVEEKASSNSTTNSDNNNIRIIVTDSQNNIIEEDSIDGCSSLESRRGPQANTAPSRDQDKPQQQNKALKFKSTTVLLVNNQNRANSLRRIPSKTKVKRQQQQQQQSQQQQLQAAKCLGFCHKKVQTSEESYQVDGSTQNHQVSQESKTCPTTHQELESALKSKERRVLSSSIYKARPVRVLSTVSRGDSFRRLAAVPSTIISPSPSPITRNTKMSRPQVMHVVESRRTISTTHNDHQTAKSHNDKDDNNDSSDTKYTNRHENASNASKTTVTADFVQSNQAETEYLKKVDAMRCYWSSLAKTKGNTEEPSQRTQVEDIRKQEIIGGEENVTTVAPTYQQDTFQNHIFHQSGNVATQHETKEYKADQGHSQQSQQKKQRQEKAHFILGKPTHSSREEHQSVFTSSANRLSSARIHDSDDFCSFMPSIEIVELEGNKKATIVSAMTARNEQDDTELSGNDNNVVDAHSTHGLVNESLEPQFDHIRYKVLKSQQLLRNKMIPRTKKEAQFDGLIQYLQEYSFQELLSNNNVVIVEPVRTKIEPPPTSMLTNRNFHCSKAKCDNNNSKNENTKHIGKNDQPDVPKARSSSGSRLVNGGIRRHFFYQPVRVNRELYEEELPTPDTVRNVRKFFEENILPTPGKGLMVRHPSKSAMPEDCGKDETTSPLTSAAQQSPKLRRARKYRHLTIDTSYGHMMKQQTQQSCEHQQPPAEARSRDDKNRNDVETQQTRRWDTASLSSGVSSGDLSSPCDSNQEPPATSTAMLKETNQLNENSTKILTTEEFKDVHVQDVIRKHNNNNNNNNIDNKSNATNSSNNKNYNQNAYPNHKTQVNSTDTPTISAVVGNSKTMMTTTTTTSMRPRSDVYGSCGDSHYYRDLYECHIETQNQQQQQHRIQRPRQHYPYQRRNCRNSYIDNIDVRGSTESNNNAETNHVNAIYFNGTIDDDDDAGNRDDNGDGDGDDDDVDVDAEDDIEDELNESYYVSNEVMEKIRECGSTITYYGGRILQSSTKSIRHLPQATEVEAANHQPTTAQSQQLLRISANSNHCKNNKIMNAKNMNITTNNVNKDKSSNNGSLLATNYNTNRIKSKCQHQQQEKPQHQDSNARQMKGIRNEQDIISSNGRHNNTKGNEACNQCGDMVSSCNEHSCKNYAELSRSEFYEGIKFKLIKSNSCSSRLELAGTDEDHSDGQDDDARVKRIVQHFEGTATGNSNSNNNATECHDNDKLKPVQDLYTASENLLTINNQVTTATGNKIDNQIYNADIKVELKPDTNEKSLANNEEQKVFVNNHINVPATTNKLDQTAVTNGNQKESAVDSVKANDARNAVISSCKPLRSVHDKDNDNDDMTTATTLSKISRNKNVDLAFAIAKKQQSMVCQAGRPKNHNQLQSSMETKSKQHLGSEATESKSQHQAQKIEQTEKLQKSGERWKSPDRRSATTQKPVQIIVPVQIHNCDASITMTTTAIATTTTTATSNDTPNWPSANQSPLRDSNQSSSASVATAIIRPQQKLTEDKRQNCLSTTSSNASLTDRNVVRHYVANDRSLFARRKYDEIEFEEFEVYDPAKELEKLIEKSATYKEDEILVASKDGDMHKNERASYSPSSLNDDDDVDDEDDGNDYDNHNDVSRGNKNYYFVKQQDFGDERAVDAADIGRRGKPKTAPSPLTTDDDLKSKSETEYCYDSLDDKL